MAKAAMRTGDERKPLELPHEQAMQILSIRASSYWGLIRKGLIKKVGSGRGSRAVYASVLAYHHARLAAPTVNKVTPTGIRRPTEKAYEELATE